MLFFTVAGAIIIATWLQLVAVVCSIDSYVHTAGGVFVLH